VADLLDFFDFFLIGYVTAALTKQWSLTYWEGGAILLASGIGAPPGAFFWGWLGDRIGRRTVFLSCLRSMCVRIRKHRETTFAMPKPSPKRCSARP
jgi:putative MFS transporter